MAPMTPMEERVRTRTTRRPVTTNHQGVSALFSRHGLGSLPNRIQGGAP